LGAKKPIPEALKREIVEKTVKERPAHATHWSVRIMGAEVGISPTSVQRIWKEYGLKPHVVRTFKVSNDPNFTEKMKDVVGLYLNPPEKALVLSVDEKSQIQALDRTQPGLPLKKGRAARQLCSRRSMWRQARSSVNACRAIAPGNSSNL
jgi:hypothetical protein